MIIESFAVGPLENNTYILVDESTLESVIIDPGMESEFLLDHIRKKGYRMRYILNTHGHFDHTYNDGIFKREFNIPILIHRMDAPMLLELREQAHFFGFRSPAIPAADMLLEGGEKITLGNLGISVIFTPGHTAGGVSFEVNRTVFVGDTIFAGSVGRTDLPGGSWDTLLRSIREKLFTMPDDTRLLSGHGPETTVGEERRWNSFLRQ